MRTYSSGLKIAAGVTLAFFLWSFGPLFQIAAWAAEKPGKQETGARSQKSVEGRKPETSGERFEKAIEEIRENVGRAEKRQEKGEDDAAEREHIRSKRAEIEGLDIELRKEFAATEKKLKDANLPKEILDRHAAFVKHYGNNLKELQANLDGIEKSKADRRALKAAFAKTKAHLEKTKAPSRHVPLDPNNLPFRTVKGKERAPRLKKEEFERDFPPQRPQRSPRTAEVFLDADGRGSTRILNSALRTPNSALNSAANEPPIKAIEGRREWARIDSTTNVTTDEHGYALGVISAHQPAASPLTPDPSRILLAFNDVASDVPFQLPLPSGDNVGSVPEWFNRGMRGDSSLALSPSLPLTASQFDLSPLSPILPIAASEPLLLAQATADLPTAADLAQTPEVQFTPEIQAKAQELGRNPVKIYEWVRNNIEFVPTYGSIQGAHVTMESKLGNAFDTASLLIALLRASGIPAKYAYGTVEIPIEKAMNWVGGVTDPKMAATVFATNGVPVRNVISGGSIKAVQIEHVWVKAFVDYIPSRGAVHKQGDTWVPLDASYKQYNYTQGMDINSAVPFDAQTFADQIKATATINEAEGYVTNVNSAMIQTTMQDYQAQVQNYIQQNHPDATVGDVIGKKEIAKQEYPFLLGTLPYKTVQAGSEFGQVPTSLRATISFNIPDFTGLGSGFSYTTSLPQIAGKKITLSFSPATANDQAIIESYLPKPHPDGTPIDPSELPTSLPAYLINLKPELRIEGIVVVTGASSMMGKAVNFTMSLNEPGIGPSNIANIVRVGEYFGIGVDMGGIGAGKLNALKAKLEATKTKLQAQNYDGLTKDEIVGDLLYTTIAAYFAELDMIDKMTTSIMDVIRFRLPSIGMFSTTLDVQEVFGIPKSSSPRGMMMDVDRIMQAVFSKDGNMHKVRQYMLMSGSISSALEHAVPEQVFSTPLDRAVGISAVKALQIANDQGISVYKISQSNINTILPQLQLMAEVKADIMNAVNAGKEVTVSKTNVIFNSWIGCGYIIADTTTGAGAYMISGGQNGAEVPLLQKALKLLKGIFFLVGFGAGLLGAPFLAAFIVPALLALFVSIMEGVIFDELSPVLEVTGTMVGMGLDVFAGILINQFLGSALFLPLSLTPFGIILLACLVTFTIVALTMLYASNFNRQYRIEFA